MQRSAQALVNQCILIRLNYIFCHCCDSEEKRKKLPINTFELKHFPSIQRYEKSLSASEDITELLSIFNKGILIIPFMPLRSREWMRAVQVTHSRWINPRVHLSRLTLNIMTVLFLQSGSHKTRRQSSPQRSQIWDGVLLGKTLFIEVCSEICSVTFYWDNTESVQRKKCLISK